MKKKNYLIYGLAKSGMASFEILYNKNDNFYLFDDDKDVVERIFQKTIKLSNVFVLKTCSLDIVREMDEVIISPSVSIYNNVVTFAKRHKIAVLSELELGFRFLKNKTIAITGTNGKTTTVSLLFEILKADGEKVVKAGNIGTPLCEVAKRISKDTVVVLEVSSFQLEAIQTFSPTYAGILNITCDHISRHKTFANYSRTKFKIFENMKKGAKIVLNESIKYANKKKFEIYQFGFGKIQKGCYVEDEKIYFSNGKRKEFVCSIYDTNLLGRHNLENVMASICFAKLLKVKNQSIINALKTFKLSPHRIQKVYERGDNFFYDDSKATNIDSTIKATQSFKTETILILGGSDKGYEYDQIFRELPSSIIQVVACGEVATKIVEAGLRCNKKIKSFDTLKQATEYACSQLKNNQNLLLSPASASFDEFKNYKDRGEKFLSYIKGYYEKT